MCNGWLKEREFQQDLGVLLKEMRAKRSKTQHEFTVPQRTIRRIEKGETPYSATLDYFSELKPCPREAAQWIRMMTELLEPTCKRCNPDCQLCGKSYLDFANAIRTQAGLPERK